MIYAVHRKSLMMSNPSPNYLWCTGGSRTVKFPADFLNAIRHNAPKKLSAPLNNWKKWEDMWTVDGDKLKSSGVAVKDRRRAPSKTTLFPARIQTYVRRRARYFLWCLEKYRLGGDPTEFGIKVKPKKFKEWGPKVQHDKRVR
ncbi:hypothetical protein FRB95_012494 [Tulasnella sp. JGI-2019a]|nr:hypothetical protein FRB95_012494 [Tulasnella sp. JGI-2019a]